MSQQTSFFSILLMNFVKFDFSIFLFAGATLYFFLRSRKLCSTLFETMHLTVFVPEDGSVNRAKTDLSNIHEYEIVALRRKEMSAYHIFINFIMIFPLLGRVCPIRRGIWFKWQPRREPRFTNQADFSIEPSSVTVNSVNEAINTGICL